MKKILFYVCILINSSVLLAQLNLQDSVYSILQTAQIESTITLLEDSVRVNSLIRNLRLLADSKKLTLNTIAGTSAEKNSDSTYGSSLSLSALSIWEHFRNSGMLMIDEVKDYGRILRYFQTNVIPDNLASLIIMVIMMTVSILSGFIGHFTISRLGNRFLNTAKQRHTKGTGCLFLFTKQFSSGAALAVILLCYGFQAGGSTFGNFILYSGYAVLIYAFMAAAVRVLFSKKYPQYRLYKGEALKNNLYFKVSTQILTFSLFTWLLYQSALMFSLGVTSYFIAGMFKIGLTLLITRLMYHVRDIVKNIIPMNNNSNNFIRITGTVLSFTLAHTYIVIFVLLSALTITSFSSDRTIYLYLLKSFAQTFVIVILITLLFWGLHLLIAQIKRYSESGTSETYFKQLLIKNKSLIIQGGYSGITVLGIVLLVNTWSANVYRIVTSGIPLLSMIVHILAIGIVSILVMQLTNMLVQSFQREALKKMAGKTGGDIEIQKRVDTLGSIFRKIAGIAVVVVAGIMIIDELGFDIKAMLAGVGIVGLAVGFGAQNLVRDVISGLFMIFENRIRVGDVAIVNGTGGLVEQVNLRTIVLRGLDGTIHVFSNGAITSLSNMTHEFSYYVFDIGIAYKENIDRVITVLNRVGESMLVDDKYRDVILEPLEILGVDKFQTSSIIIKARIKTLPIKQWMIGREMNKRIKNEFHKEGIEIPFPHQSLCFGETSKPFEMKIEGLQSLIESLKSSPTNRFEEKQQESV